MSRMSKRMLAIILCFLMLPAYIVLFSASANAASNDVCGINSGTTYYIKNVYNGKYIDVYDGADSNGTNVWTYTFNASNAQKWRVVRNSDGTYTFYAVVSSNNRVLDVTGTNVDIWSYNSSLGCQKFSLQRNTSMAYGGTYQIKYGSKYVIANASSSTVEVSSTGSGLNALWSFEPVVKGDADIYTFYYQTGSILGIIPDYFDSRGAASTFVEKCSNMGYTPYHLTNKSASSAYTCMKVDAIWVFCGHGTSSSGTPIATISFKNEDGGNNGHITTNIEILNDEKDRAVDSLPANALAKSQCVLYMGCRTGVSYSGFNLVSSTFNKGAHFVLGTTKTLYTDEIEKWTKKFFEKANTGATIRQCIDYANYYQDIGLLYYEGDVYTKLK